MMSEDTTINNVTDYLEWVRSTFVTKKGGISFEQTKVYYRGQSDSSWDIKPSALREIKEGSDQILNESRLLKSALRYLWNEMLPFQTYLEKLIYLQHYGLGTRLLDVTFNPLIALYMACIENKKDEKDDGKDGIVYCGHQIEHYNSVIAEYSAEYLFTTNQVNMDFLDLESYANNHKIAVQSFTTPLFIFPPINNPRIEAQDGAFIMSPLVKCIDECIYIANKDKLDNSDFFDNRRAIINKNCKENILKELSLLGINTGTIYKDVTYKLQSIRQEEIWRTFKYELDI